MASATTSERLAPIGGGSSGAAVAAARSEIGVDRQAAAKISPGRLSGTRDVNGGRAALLGQGDPALLEVRCMEGGDGRSVRIEVLSRAQSGVVLRRGTAPLPASGRPAVHERVLSGDDDEVRDTEYLSNLRTDTKSGLYGFSPDSIHLDLTALYRSSGAIAQNWLQRFG